MSTRAGDYLLSADEVGASRRRKAQEGRTSFSERGFNFETHKG
jgi:hypothetical protein